ncbi:cysteine hydrolase [Sphaerisporangium album]|uniref:Cysteine hydrolase n=1 Tax=Sphaerisporangium album TaxID=509200 RepID=A0A367F3C4_9ACTN|nr:isochorismatase family cysteine hydrolase [Sphaerisporangium album]RCG24000.1 cysteine hydrolase [Sphaerisporangium album]
MSETPDPRRCALLAVNVQNDFTRHNSLHALPGTDEIVPVMGAVVDGFRALRLPVVHMVRLYHADGSNAEVTRRSLVAAGVPVVRPGTEGSEVRPELQPPDGFLLDHEALLEGKAQPVAPREWVMYKPRWGAFYDTGLAAHLRALDVDTVAVIGTNFPNCPRTTIYEASERDFHVVVVSDAISRIYPRGLDECASIGARVLTSDRLLDWLRAAR